MLTPTATTALKKFMEVLNKKPLKSNPTKPLWFWTSRLKTWCLKPTWLDKFGSLDPCVFKGKQLLKKIGKKGEFTTLLPLIIEI